jgi:hypothetical protein
MKKNDPITSLDKRMRKIDIEGNRSCLNEHSEF